MRFPYIQTLDIFGSLHTPQGTKVHDYGRYNFYKACVRFYIVGISLALNGVVFSCDLGTV